MVVLKHIVEAMKKEPITTASLFLTIIALTLINLGVIKPLFVEVHFQKFSFISSVTSEATLVSLGAILLVLAIGLFITLMIRLRK